MIEFKLNNKLIKKRGRKSVSFNQVQNEKEGREFWT